MTLLSLKRAWAPVVLAVALSSCGGSAPDGAHIRESRAATAAAQSALERAEELEERVHDLEDRVAEARRERRSMRRSVARRSERLRTSIARVSSALKDLRSSVAAAGGEAESAAAAAGAAARDLSVLTRRFDYHLRSHGRG